MPVPPPRPRLPEASPYAGHIPALDGIRGLAVLAVMSSHLFPGTPRSPLTHALQVTLAFGATGVDLFFVLSGFLITGILFDSLASPHFFRNFYARRILRIFPLYYGVLALYALAALFAGLRFNHQLESLALYLQNTHLLTRSILDYDGPSLLPLAHFWTLAIEEQFYLLWPLVLFTLRTRRRLLALCLLFTLACPLARAFLWLHGWSYFSVHANTLLRADSLLAGAALALLLRSPAHDRTLRLAPWLTLAAAFAAAAIILTPALPGPTRPWWPAVSLSLRYTAFDLLFAGLLALALQPSPIQRLCRVNPLRSLGRYSYGLYVLHLIVFTYLEAPLRTLIATHLTPNKAAGILLTGLTGFVLSLLAAITSYHLYEKPFLRLKRFFSYRRQSPTPT